MEQAPFSQLGWIGSNSFTFLYPLLAAICVVRPPLASFRELIMASLFHPDFRPHTLRRPPLASARELIMATLFHPRCFVSHCQLQSGIQVRCHLQSRLVVISSDVGNLRSHFSHIFRMLWVSSHISAFPA